MADAVLTTDTPQPRHAGPGLPLRGFLKPCGCGIGFHDNLRADDTCSHCGARHDVTTRHPDQQVDTAAWS